MSEYSRFEVDPIDGSRREVSTIRYFAVAAGSNNVRS